MRTLSQTKRLNKVIKLYEALNKLNDSNNPELIFLKELSYIKKYNKFTDDFLKREVIALYERYPQTRPLTINKK